MDSLSLTYQELAERLGLEREAARQLVKRRQWMKWKGNDGQVRISVPQEAVSFRAETGARPDAVSGVGPDVDRANEPVADRAETGAIPVLTRHIERLEQALEAAQKKAEELERALTASRDQTVIAEKAQAVTAAQIDALNAALAVERRQAEERIAAERQRAEDWKLAADRFASQAEKLAEAAATMRRPWWKRLAG